MGFSYPSWMEWYKKPSQVNIKEFSLALNGEAGSRRNSDRSMTGSIPVKLSLEKILNNRTCSPMSLYDFYMYLKHIEHSSENLEFYVWFRDYQARYAKEPGDSSAHFGPTAYEEDQPLVVERDAAMYARDIKHVKTMLKEKRSDLSNTNSQSELVDAENYSESLFYIESLINSTSGCNFNKYARSGNGPSTPWASSATTNEKYLHELSNIADVFLVQGSPKELNIPDSMRKQVLKSIATSTSPENLEPVASHVYLLLQSCSHRNFIRLSVSNGTYETLCMATSLGIVLILSGFLGMFLLAFASPSMGHSSRWRGLGISPLWALGTAFILAGTRGSCFFLLLFSRRQPLPWERFDDAASAKSHSSKVVRFARKLMILDRKLKVRDITLRQLQRKIVIQSTIGGVFFAAVMETFFLLLPIWK